MRNDSQQTFGDLLRRARRAAGLTQEELAEQAGLSVRGISDLERGARLRPRIDTLELLAEALNLSDAELLEWRRAGKGQPRQQPASLPDAPAVPPRTLAGREREFQLLGDSIRAATYGRGQIILLAGEPGIGKTRLAEDLSVFARNQNFTVLWGRCHEGEGAPAYWPWIQAIRSLVDVLAPDVLRRDLGRSAAAISRIVPEVADNAPGLLAAHQSTPEQARFELFDNVARFMRSVSLRSPLLLVFDDLHWADQSTLDMLAFLSYEIEQDRVAILGTYRDTELDLAANLEETLAGLSRRSLSQHLILSGLPEAETGALIERVLNGPPEAAITSAIYQRTGGNPFFAGELARLMIGDDGQNDAAALTAIPPGVKGVLAHRYRRLSPECREMLDIASVTGREFQVSMLEAFTSATRQQLLAALDEALRARLIERMAGSSGRYRFTHALVRETLYEALPTGERAKLHQQAGEFLEVAHDGELEPHLSLLAHHFFEAIPLGDVDRAIDYAVQAGDRAGTQFAHAESVDHYRQALEAMDLQLSGNSVWRCEILLRLGEACNHAGQYAAAQDAFVRAADISRDLNLPEQLARAAVGAAGLGVIEHDESRQLQLLEDAATALAGHRSALRSHVLSRLAILLQGTETLDHRLELADEAAMIARDLGDSPELLYALLARRRSLWAPAFRAHRLESVQELAALADAVGGDRSMPALAYRMYDYLEAGEISALDPMIEMFDARARELHQPQRIWIATSMRTMRALMDGRLDEVEGLNDLARATGAPAAPALAETDHFMFRFFLYREQGRLAELAEPARQINAWHPRDVFWQTLLTVLKTAVDGAPQPYLSVEELVERIERDSPVDGLAIAAGMLAVTTDAITGRRDHAERLYAAMAPYGQYTAVLPNSRHFHCLGSISHALGRLASGLGRLVDAGRHFEHAIEMHCSMRAELYLAYTRYECARMKVARGEAGDRGEARRLAGQAKSTADDLGFTVLAARADALLATLAGN